MMKFLLLFAESLAQIHPDLRVAFILMNQFTLAPVSG
jgi:hypothetical protein